MSNHYEKIDGHSLEDFIYELPFYVGNIMKYAWRAPYKNGIDDTIKLLDYLDMSHYGWVNYDLSDRATMILSEISSCDFYDKASDTDKAHWKCISSVADWILNSEGSGGLDYESQKQLILSVASLQVSLFNK